MLRLDLQLDALRLGAVWLSLNDGTGRPQQLHGRVWQCKNAGANTERRAYRSAVAAAAGLNFTSINRMRLALKACFEKGKPEPGDRPVQTALHEVREETPFPH